MNGLKRPTLHLFSLTFLASTLTFASWTSAEEPSLARYFPDNALMFAEVTDLKTTLKKIHNSHLLEQILKSPQWQTYTKSPQYKKAYAGKIVVEKQFNTDLWNFASKLFGKRIAVGLYPQAGNKQPLLLAVIDAEDAKSVEQFRKQIDPFLAMVGDNVKIEKSSGGSEVIEFGGQLMVAIHSGRMVVSNNKKLFADCRKALTGNTGSKLAENAAYKKMQSQMKTGHFVSVYLNSKMIANAQGGHLFPAKLDNALASLLFGGIAELASKSPYVGFAIDYDNDKFQVTASVDGDASKLSPAHRVFFSSAENSGTDPLPAIPNLIGGVTLHRDIGKWYQQRDNLIAEQTLPDFDKFEAGIANLLPGKDFGNDVLPTLGTQVTLVSAPQSYSHLNGKPGIQFPGFAAIFKMAQPKEGSETVQLFFQTLTAILNIQAGQQGREPWLVKTKTHRDTTITYGSYLKKPQGKRLHLVYNFQPAMTQVGSRMILSSSVELCEQLIDAYKEGKKTADTINRNLNFRISTNALANILDANKNFFNSRSIQGGKTPQQAGIEFQSILKALNLFSHFDLTTTVKKESFQATLVGSWAK